jgi:UDP-2-acetamido-3-amino-2,3-dideoxy-glucuronate N-acetyltransferase
MKLGLIGCGKWGKNLAREFDNLKILTQICDINKPNDFDHIQFTNDWNKLLNDVDIICIALPANLHYKYAKEALLLNKDVFIEKPMTLHKEEAQELVNIAKNNNKIIFVGHIMHYNPGIIKLKELLISEKIKSITTTRYITTKIDNPLWDLAPHDISLCNKIINGKISKIKHINNDNINKLIFDIDEVNVNINVGSSMPYKEQKIIIICEKSIIIFDDVEKKLWYNNNEIKFNNEMPLTNECKEFIKCCQNRTNPLTNGQEGLNVISILDQCRNVDYYYDKTAIIDDKSIIGKNSKIWHNSHITSEAIIGNECNIGQGCYIAGIIGNNCRVQNNVNIYKGVICGNNVFFGPNCTTTNDITPRAKYPHQNYVETIIEDDVSIGAGAVIRCGIKLGRGCFIGCGSVVVKNCEEYGLYVGNPAKKIGKVDEGGKRIINIYE